MALLIPKNFKFLGKDQPTLYKEATSKKKDDTTTTTTTQTTSIPKHFGNVVPLIGSDGTTKEFTVMAALAEAQKNGRLLSSLKDADPYVLQNGSYYWTGELILYPAPDKKFGPKLTYTDGNNVSYECNIPSQFQNETGQKALKLMNGYFDDGTPYFKFAQKASNLWALHFNLPDQLIQSGLLKLVSIHRKNDWYLTDAELIPNGNKSASSDKAARYFYQIDNSSYLGLLRRDVDYDVRRGVNAGRRPSYRCGVLAYE